MSEKTKFIVTRKGGEGNQTEYASVDAAFNAFDKFNHELETKALNKAEKLRQLRADATKMVSMANKRIRRLEKNDLKNSPAYQAYLSGGGKPFSVKGKDYNQLQAEMAKMRSFIDSQTSTVRGYNNYLKDMAKITGMEYKNLKQLKSMSSKFFQLGSMVQQYLRTIEQMGSAIGYQKIWESINVYVKEQKIDLADSDRSIDQMTADIAKAIKEYDTPFQVSNEWFKLEN